MDSSSFSFPEVSFSHSHLTDNSDYGYQKSINSSAKSESIESPDGSGSIESEFHDDDSFAGRVSNTGMSSEESSINSHSSYNRFTGTHDNKYTRKHTGDNKYMKPKSTSRHLPRLTIQTKRTKDLLAQNDTTHHVFFEKPSETPMSLDTKQTSLSTPSTRNQQEFPPVNSFSSTPKIHMSETYNSTVLSPSSNSSGRGIHSTNKTNMKNLVEKEYWKYKLKMTLRYHGGSSVQAAKAFSDLAAALLKCKESSEALKLYKLSASIYRETYGDDNLIVARMLNQVGLSASLSHSSENLQWALLALKESLHIRIKYLGLHHVDVVDTMNNIAGVYLHKRELEVAKELYTDVMIVRAHIFGKDHPSVAVTAQTLGKVYSRLSDFQNSIKHYDLALEIYQGETLRLPSNHPLVVKVRDELVNVERIAMIGINK